jgi:hypothetical protein
VRRIPAVFLCVFSIAFGSPLAAQTSETGVLHGQVLGGSSQPLVSASVAVAQADGAHARSTTTNESGSFRVGFLPPGLYDVTVRIIGHRTQTLVGVRVSATRVSTITVTLETAAVAVEELRVVASRDLIDGETTEFNTVVQADEIERLPLARTATDIIKLTPGARPDQIFGGSTEQANSYQLDGVSVNQPGSGGEFLLPNVDWIEEVVVQGLGAGAEYGNFQGGLYNIVTKSGDNTWRSQGRFNFTGAGLTASNSNTFEAGAELDSRWELNGELRGPLVQDKLFFYVSAQEVRSNIAVVDVLSGSPDSPSFIVGPDGNTLFEERREFKLLGKLTWLATSTDVFNVYLGKDDVYTDNAGLNSFDDPSTTVRQESPAGFFNASWQRTFSDNHLFELKFTGYSGRDDFLPLNGDLSAVRLLEGNRNAFRNASFVRDREPSSLGVSANWDSYWNTGSVEHHLKVGGDVEFGSWLETRTRTGGLTWRPFLPDGGMDAFVPDDPSTWGFISSDWAGDIHLDANTLNGGIYLQDYMAISDRLSINPGVRLGFWKGDVNPLDAESFTAVEDVRLAPRLGLVYDVTGDDDLVFKGHYGRYYQSLFALMFDRAEGGNVFQPEQYWDWVADEDPDINRRYSEAERDQYFEFFGESGAFQTGPVENYAQPYVDQFVVGLEKAFAETWKAGVVYVNRRNRDILSLQDRNLSTNYTPFESISVINFEDGSPIMDANGDPLVLDQLYVSNDDILFLGGAPGLTPEEVDDLTYEQDLVLSTVEDAQRRFDQVQVSVERQTATWQARASVVWTDLRGNFYSVSGYENPFGTGSGAFVRPNEQTNFDGKLGNFSDWEGKFLLNGDLPAGFRGGAYLQIFSGDHYTPTYVIDRRNHDFVTENGEVLDPDLLFGVDGEAIFIEQRGSRAFDAQATLDLHVDKVIPIGGTDIVVGLDAFNIFGSDAITSVKTTVNDQIMSDPTTQFGAPRFRVAPRSVRLMASFRIP